MTPDEFDAKIDVLLSRLKDSDLLTEDLDEAPTFQKGPLRPSKVAGRELGLSVTRAGIDTFTVLMRGETAKVEMGVTVSLLVKGIAGEAELERVANVFGANAYRALVQLNQEPEWQYLRIDGSTMAERTETEQMASREEISCTMRWTTSVPQPE